MGTGSFLSEITSFGKMMNTKTGKIEAKKRTKILKKYLTMLKKEI